MGGMANIAALRGIEMMQKRDRESKEKSKIIEILEDNLKMALGLALGSQGIWTPELEELIIKEIKQKKQ
jgi:hypothetical protein